MSLTKFLYGGTVFLSAFLLFLVEPMAAKEILPALGGSSAVWMTCLVFFQTVLLFGYLYAHWMGRAGGRERRIHAGVLVAAVAVAMAMAWAHPMLSGGSSHPVATIFLALTVGIGLPFLLLGSTSPLLQAWRAHAESGAVPYRLFALSNGASLLALVLYPLLIEPYMSLRHQRIAWSVGFAMYAALSLLLTLRKRLAKPAMVERGASAVVPLRTRVLWFLLPMVAAMQLSSVTSHLTSNIAAIPLLWVLPLAAYLLSFIVAFEFPALYRRGVVVRFLVLMLASLGYALSKTDVTLPIAIGVLFFLVEGFVACLFCHAEVYALRPQSASAATMFYLYLAAGGVTGTFLIGIVSPMVFSANYDLALSFFLTASMALVVVWGDGWEQRLLWATGSGLLFALIVMLHIVYAREALLEVRNFYGSLRVKQMQTPAATQPVRMLMNGTIQHGTQLFGPGLSGIPTTYYAENSGVGLVIANCCGSAGRNIGVVGLGAGTLAAYGRAGDRMRFYEINPQVRPIAENLFTYLRDSKARISFSEGDARTSLSREAAHGFDVLVVDAFSGDAIPLHLLTGRAMEIYRRHLAPGGVLAFHVSNQYLNLAPEIGELARASGMEAREVDSLADDARGAYAATWVLVTANRELLTRPAIAARAVAITPINGLQPWTDDYSSLMPIMKWGYSWH